MDEEKQQTGPSAAAAGPAGRLGLAPIKPELVDNQNFEGQFNFGRLVVILSVLAFTLFVSFLDQTSVSTALPAIATDLNAFETISWIGTSFLIANTSFQLINGRLSDIFGRRTCLIICMVLLAVGDLMCGFAKSAVALYTFRGIAGIGAGGINSLVMIIFSDLTTLQQRGKYQGLMEVNIALGNGVGPLIGGAFSQSRAGWRWTFWFVVPVTVLAGIAVFLVIPQSQTSQGRTIDKVKMIDYPGMLLSLAGVIFLLIPISGGGTTYDWSSALVISFLAIGAILITAFIIVQYRFARHPTMPFRLFERTSAKILFAHNFASGVVYYTDLYYLPLYYQVILDKTPLISGVLILPLILGFSLASAAGGFAISRLGRCLPVIRTGYVLWTAGAGGRVAFGPRTGIATIAGCLVVEGVGLGLSMQPVMIALLSNTRKEDRAVVTGLRNFLRTVGGAVGLGIAAAIINNVLLEHLPAGLPREAASQLSVLLDTLPVAERAEVVAVYMRGLHVVFILGAPLIGACLISSAFLTDVPLATAHDKYKNEGGGEGVALAERGVGAAEKRKQSDGAVEADAGEGASAVAAEGETGEQILVRPGREGHNSG
ncbi:mfs transporter [Diplodia corticola]|uniref:Mfs transporter n=1 Tax=Diplodia corticola TaxID=236234 RepID=A0A1J9SMK6_9PEZI|nr:mfs transporter [Diplodia corticola]OJD40845.1 mfs transporter [Diplodia corticola]